MSYSGWYFKIWGGDQYDQSHGETSVNYSDTPTGIRITANDVPLQENGEYYPYYRIRYILKLKDGVNLDDLAIENGGQFDLTNEAVKVDHYDGSKKLAGVQFRLYSPERRENGNRYDLSLDNSGVYEMVLTTDENGVIAIDGTKIKIYFGVMYYLEEIAPPDGYQNLSFPYRFTLVDDADLVN